jgi:hypothetical protein
LSSILLNNVDAKDTKKSKIHNNSNPKHNCAKLIL